MLLQVDEVIKRFGSTLALDCCSMQVEEGEVVGLLGPNGAGKKTTCIRSIIGLIPIDEGSITVFSRNQDGKKPRNPAEYRVCYPGNNHLRADERERQSRLFFRVTLWDG